MLSGQLSIGWLNDYVDRDLDRAAVRPDKPISADALSARAVRTAAVVAAGACVVLSLLLGPLPGLVHLVAVASAYSYDLWLKPTPLSWAPFALSFGLLPAVVTTALPGRPWPDAWVMLAGGALGVAAHFANTVKDVEADAATGVRGLPQRLGPRRALTSAAALVAVAGLALVLATRAALGPVVCALVALVAAVVAARGGRRTAFGGFVLAAAVVVVGLVSTGSSWS